MKTLFKWFGWMVLCVAGLVGLVKLYHAIKYMRIEKSHPNYVMTIHGAINPKIAKQFRFFMEYATTHSFCDQVNYFEGVRGVRTKAFDIKMPSVDSQGHFTLKIPLDRYYPGICGWRPDVFGMTYGGFEYGLFAFSNKKNNRIKQINIECHIPFGPFKLCTLNKKELGAYRYGYSFLLPFNKNSQIKVSIGR